MQGAKGVFVRAQYIAPLRVLRGFALFSLYVLTVVVFGIDIHAQSNCAPRQFADAWPETDFCEVSIDLETVLSGGVPRDGIPAVTDPAMDSVEAARAWLVEQSPVIAVEINGEARAYPQAILMWHEIANDTIGSVPAAITFCPLCNSSIVFDRRVDEAVLEFGVSGNLRNSDMIMYDRTTYSWWQQFTGEGIVGFYNETQLAIIPSQVIGFGHFAERYPDGLVMSRETGHNRPYGVNPYTGLDSERSGVIALYQGEYDDRLPRRSRVLAGVIDDIPMAYPFAALAENRVINDTIGTLPVVALWQPGVASALDQSEIDASQDIGTTALFSRDVGGQVLTFRYDTAAHTMVDEQTGSRWTLFGEATAGELQGTRLQLLVAAPHFWFAWVAFYPETRIYAE